MALVLEQETYKIVGACMAVHRTLGNGFLESVYEEALEKEFIKRNIPYKRQHKLNVLYDDKPLDKYFKADFLCFENIIVELKAAKFLHDDNNKQVINYIKAANKPVGLLVNFGEKSLKWKRFVNSPSLK